MKYSPYSTFFETIGSKTRLKILEALVPRPLSVSEISKELKEEQSNISHNLKQLVNCNILDVKRKGKQRIYSLNKETTLPLMKIAENHVRKHCMHDCSRCKK
jgi:DNA-binding transcriptional ArsR family regulator